ncbi:hypothetical protein VNI00_015371 [Paramarasmius palmivorus]|uniref:Uncharacterized protein n=1 Tax=Paramarasmius palmivorus TaxID=297713 RepID=A0AAW0BCW8_9AGAR
MQFFLHIVSTVLLSCVGIIIAPTRAEAEYHPPQDLKVTSPPGLGSRYLLVTDNFLNVLPTIWVLSNGLKTEPTRTDDMISSRPTSPKMPCSFRSQAKELSKLLRERKVDNILVRGDRATVLTKKALEMDASLSSVKVYTFVNNPFTVIKHTDAFAKFVSQLDNFLAEVPRFLQPIVPEAFFHYIPRGKSPRPHHRDHENTIQPVHTLLFFSSNIPRWWHVVQAVFRSDTPGQHGFRDVFYVIFSPHMWINMWVEVIDV